MIGALSTLDYVLAAAGTRQRPADFGIVLHFAKGPTLEALRRGSISARNRYPISNSVIRGRQWTPIAVPEDGVVTSASVRAAEAFFEEPFDPWQHAPIRQLLIMDAEGGAASLITRVHHAAADGCSAALWLRHQLRVATGMETAVRDPTPFNPAQIRRRASPVRTSPFAHRAPCESLWTRSELPSASRRWLTMEFPGTLPQVDVVATTVLETLAAWNSIHNVSTRRIGLWFPVDVRVRGNEGFGNGTSRIRLYPAYPDAASFAEKCKSMRRQIRWALKHGEWAVPQCPAVTRLPLWLTAAPLRRYLNRTSADMGTIAFSHIAHWRGQDAAFQGVTGIECVGQLHQRHALVMNCINHRGRTWLTLTFDPARLVLDDVAQFADLFTRHLVHAGKVAA